MNSVNQVAKGTVIYGQGKEIESISLIVKGRVLVYNNGIKSILGPGSFLGLGDLYNGTYGVTCFAAEEITLYVFPIRTIDDVESLLDEKSEYRGTMVVALTKYISELHKTHTILKKSADILYTVSKEFYEEYKEIGRKSDNAIISIPEIDGMEEIQLEDPVDERLLDYYIECSDLPLETQKAYYSGGPQISVRHIGEQIELISQYRSECSELAGYIYSHAEGLISDKEECLYKAVSKLALDMKKNNTSLLSLLDKIEERINEIEKVLMAKTGRKLTVNHEKMEQIHQLVLTETEGAAEENGTISNEAAVKFAGIDTDGVEDELKDSLQQILQYSQLEEAKCNEFKASVEDFISLRDKNDTRDDVRRLRRQLAEEFYGIYEAVFLRAHRENDSKRIIDLFLNYGYIDERLLTKEQLIELYFLEDKDDNQGPCKVYTIKEWLTEVYEGRKEPSKSEFDMDYAETLRDMKKSGRIREQEMKEALENPLKKLQYEIQNMFKYNNRITSGLMSVFVPFLHKDLFVGHVDQSLLTTNKINEMVKKITEIDYSIFYRETMYTNPEKKIDKEFIMVEVYPDIILMPVFGTGGAMWQEITGKKRASSGRFLFPIFAEGDIEEVFLKVCGRFRWELCRTIQGTAWNDVTMKSLTSEYCDYIQFYRKNRDLSEEKKEKLKMQIQKGRGNTREVFVIDYITWVKFECTGSIRLNKVARSVLASWCPFRKEIREKLETQPLFQDAMAAFNRNRQKRLKELDLRYRTLETKKIEIPKELEDNLVYYRDM